MSEILLKLKAQLIDGSIDLIIKKSKSKPAICELSDALKQVNMVDLVSSIKKDIMESGYDSDTFFKYLSLMIAVVRLAGNESIGLSLFDEQVLGGLVLFSGNVTEMSTGEGKTLVGVLPCFLNYILGKSTFVVTVNDYLAKRDKEWMEPVYNKMGMSVGVIQCDMINEERKYNYNKDVVYGSNKEFGFDYLRDNMCFDVSEIVQKVRDCVIIDEVDSVLIDEARIPLIISGLSKTDTLIVKVVNSVLIKLLDNNPELDIVIDKKNKNIVVGDDFWNLLGKYCNNINIKSKHVRDMFLTALMAYKVYDKDVEYLVDNGRVVIIDEFTGRRMDNRRYKGGLHQALEAKEGVYIENETQNLGMITYQKYFGLFDKISGMSATAKSDEIELKDLYGMDVFVVKPHKKCKRTDRDDVVLKTERKKWNKIISLVKEANSKGKPVLVGTRSVEKSELLGMLLKNGGIQCEILNAKNNSLEADIVKKAGSVGAVTVATNMAGRGTDIVVDNKIVKKGGLLVIGSERHNAKRIDMQLRGRTGRQGDAGESIFVLSLEDDFIRGLTDCCTNIGFETGVDGVIDSEYLIDMLDNHQTIVEKIHSKERKFIYDMDSIFDEVRKQVYDLRMKWVVGGFGVEDVINYLKDFDSSFLESLSLSFVDQNIINKASDIGKAFNKIDNDSMRHIFLSVLNRYWVKFLESIDDKVDEVKKDVVMIDEFRSKFEIDSKELIRNIFLDFSILMVYNIGRQDIVIDIDKIIEGNTQ